MFLNFQDFIKNYKNLEQPKIVELPDFYFLRKPHWIPSSFGKQKSILDMLENNELPQDFTQNQLKFPKEQEYWLLNRLDNDTAWFLYFAKTPEIYDNFKQLQKQNKITKIYYAQVKWKPFETIITYPIMHKNKSKMIVIKSEKDKKKWRWKLHFVQTKVKPIQNNWIKVEITKWIRHQIRAHLSSIWLPIKNDPLYWENNWWKLQLYSVGIVNC